MERIQNIWKKHLSSKFRVKNSSIEYRLQKLDQLKSVVLSNREAIAVALKQDFNKPKVEVDLTEIMPVISIINLTQKELTKWCRPEKVKGGILFAGTKNWIRHEAKGNTLLIGPWNYPFQLTMYPLISGFCAGNTVIVKPSEFTPNINKVMNTIIEQIFDEDEVTMIEGDADVSTELLKLPFDHIFFTGSSHVGKIVMEAAAKNLASVTLELGGKSPVLIDQNVNLNSAAQKIVWGKFLNGGQTCVAPDYVLVTPDKREELVDQLKHYIGEHYPNNNWKENKDYACIITDRHAKRLDSLIQDAVAKGAIIEIGGEYLPDERIITPTIMSNVPIDCALMKEEIFGPILPIVECGSTEEMIEFVNERENPLALYVFSEDKLSVNKILNNTCSGSVAINDVVVQLGNPNLPFGGAGASGIGKYHGRYGFEEYSNKRSVLQRDMDLGVAYFYPPYGKRKESIVEGLLNKLTKIF